ncbi:MAG: SpoIIE family protein phosphatase [bacterium]|nr:SpoIIE family protein phosphatase [bacterium]
MGKLFSRAIICLGYALLLYCCAFYCQDVIKLVKWTDSGRVNIKANRSEEGAPLIFESINTANFPDAAVLPALGDTLISFVLATGDTILTGETGHNYSLAGDEATVTFTHDNEVHQARLIFTERQRGQIALTIMIQVVRALISLGFLIVGLWALSKRPYNTGVRLLALFSFSMTSLMIAAVDIGFNNIPAFAIPGQNIIGQVLEILGVSFGAFWFNLQLYFPNPFPRLQRRAWLINLAIFLPQIVILSLAFVQIDIWGPVRGPVQGILISLQVCSGFFILGYRLAKTRDPLERRQLSLVTWGSGFGLGLLFIMVIMGTLGITQRLPDSAGYGLILLTFFGLLLSPISFAFAFGRYRLLEVEGRLQRGTRYLLVTGGLLLIFFTLLYFASGFLLETFALSGRGPTLAVSLVLALGFSPLHRRTQGVFEERIYPERQRLRAILAEFHAKTAALTDRDELFTSLEESLKKGIGITALVPAMGSADDSRFLLPGEQELPFTFDGQLMQTLRELQTPQLVDELQATDHIDLTPDEAAWLEARHVCLILPLCSRSDLNGLLFLTSDDNWDGLGVGGLEELRTLSRQIALECENLSLLEVSLDKKRLEEQLDMARQVQEGFLPASLPDSPGLELAACFRSCLEVAGDYYDVVAMPEGRTLIAVGDVSGKGAGAAMIMANLQASIRSMTRVNVPLGEMVEGINDIIHANTPPGQFITFFAAVYDPATRKLTFVNAGHNPPRVIHNDGSNTELGPIGPILGVFPGLPYGEQDVELVPGDTFVAFTDGVSEAMNIDDDDFGEERIVEAVAPERTKTPDKLLTTIEEAVDDWRGEVELGDDYTIVIGRVQ